MRKNFVLLLLITFLFCGCQKKTTPAEIAGAKKAIVEMLDKSHQAFIDKKLDNISVLLADSGLFCGTDPSELWNKKALCDEYAKGFADTAVKIQKPKLEKREILVQKDGNSAIVLEQLKGLWFCPNVSLRNVYYVVKEKDNWKISFSSVSLIPYNKDIPLINKAVEQQK
ncbi:nuclear transport factor 2 family protein [uncultured Bacteroides sp.]|uniref:nuclear transport factor 2 family protein n=1 Tax=uncultured Bacteroides sp. TaxID=162156 RepID=UPI002AAAFE8C|nr:nuclear transport factor 2 family protein [uncultured Bacteroides sp.]